MTRIMMDEHECCDGLAAKKDDLYCFTVHFIKIAIEFYFQLNALYLCIHKATHRAHRSQPTHASNVAPFNSLLAKKTP
jgi:hypothetical protein